MSSEKHITDSTSQYTSRHCIITWAP